MRVGIDIDGVIRDFISSLEEVYDKYYLSFVEGWRKPVTKWELNEFFSIGKHIYDFAFDTYAHEIFYKYAKPYENAIEFLNKLHEKHSILLATSQNKKTLNATLKWLDFYDVPYDEFYCTFNGVKNINTPILLDDNIGNLLDFKNISICMDRPWNKEYNGFRISKYDEFFDYLK